jgi:cyanophycin synthetase
VTGTNGKTTVARLTAHLLAADGLRVGLTTTDGVYVDGRLVQRADATGPRSAQTVLGDPTVSAAVLETARGGILRQGLGYDWTDVGVVTNVGNDHLGQHGVDTVEDILHVKALIAERVRDGGTLVLNADDARVRSLVGRDRVRAAHKRLVWFSLLPQSRVLASHCAGGGRAYTVADGWLVEREGTREKRLIRAAELPGGFGGQAGFATANALAAVAAATALGVPSAEVGGRLRSFAPLRANPGRGALLRLDGVHILVDYAHNPGALRATGDLVHRAWGPDRSIAVVTLPGDRRDDLLAESARTIADRFDRVVLYEDVDRRGRATGEVPDLVRREIRAYRPRVACTVLHAVEEAVRAALALAVPGDVVLLIYEEIEPVLDLLAGLGAEPVADPAAAVAAAVDAQWSSNTQWSSNARGPSNAQWSSNARGPSNVADVG